MNKYILITGGTKGIGKSVATELAKCGYNLILTYASDIDAALIHEAAIGKIAGEQIIKLMTLGLSESEAEEQIVNGFLK